MKSTSLPRQLAVFMAVFVAVVAVGSGVFVLMLRGAYQSSGAQAAAAVQTVGKAYTLLERFSAGQDLLQLAIRTKDPDELEKVLERVQVDEKATTEMLSGLGAVAGGIAARYDTVKAAERQVIDAVLKGDNGAANERFIQVVSPRYEEVSSEVGLYYKAQAAASAAEMDALANRGAAEATGLVAGISVSAVILIGFMWRMRRRMVDHLAGLSSLLAESTEQIASTSQQVAAGSQTTAQGSTEQAASLEETSASLEEIATAAQQNAKDAFSAKSLSADTRRAAESGRAEMQAMVAAMDDIKVASSAIASVIKTIDEIAFQTNLLALNAAVEAARAGQAGLGFAVVADEVRTLAQRSATAAKETASRVETVIATSLRGARASGQVSSSFDEIVGRARQVDQLVASIAEASSQQNTSLGQLNHAVTEIGRVTQAGATSSQESAAAAGELNTLADGLREMVGQLQQLVGAVREVPTPAPDATVRPAGGGTAVETAERRTRMAA